MICNTCNEDTDQFYPKRKKCISCINARRRTIAKASRVKENQRMREYRNSPSARLAHNLRNRLYFALNGIIKKGRTLELLGCTIDEFKVHLSISFQEGMTFENYGEWHVDHIIPCSSFNLAIEEEQKKCFHYTNLQPLWAIDNLVKGSTLP